MSCSYIVLVQDQEMEWKWVKDEMLQGEIYVEPVLTWGWLHLRLRSTWHLTLYRSCPHPSPVPPYIWQEKTVSAMMGICKSWMASCGRAKITCTADRIKQNVCECHGWFRSCVSVYTQNFRKTIKLLQNLKHASSSMAGVCIYAVYLQFQSSFGRHVLLYFVMNKDCFRYTRKHTVLRIMFEKF